GVYIFRWAVNNGTCPVNSDDVQITIYDLPSIASAGSDQHVCNTDSITMAANTPLTGTGTWTQVSGPNTPNIVAVNTGNTVMNGLIAGTYIFSWTISNGVCSNATDTVQVVIDDLPSVAVA